MAIKRFQEIEAWRSARRLAIEIGGVTARDGVRQDFDFCNQIRRATTSVMSNIAEGFGRRTDKDFARFVEIARGSAAEVQSLLVVAFDRSYISSEEFKRMDDLADKTQAQLTSFARYLRAA
jgi:four helix bundle protein